MRRKRKLRFGKDNPFWKGGRTISKDGYVWLRLSRLSDKDLELAKEMKISRNMVAEHRLIMARKIGRPLERSEIVHHINGIKSDNREENLFLYSQRDHLLNDINKIRKMTCPKCGHQWHY